MKRSPAAETRTYHHGDLRTALLDAAEAILSEGGAEGFTLREAARRAGVSPAAPAHHFGNVAGLLAAVAVLGFEELSDAMEAAEAAAGDDAGARLEAICRAYVTFALRRPGRFRVTFGPASRPGEVADPALVPAARRAYGILHRVSAAALPGEGDAAGGAVFAWSLVHGIATLLVDGRLDFLSGRAGGAKVAETFLPVVLARLRG